MEFFNIHLTELLIIAGLALVIFGPERLPELGRFAGKHVARFLAWQQQSPEFQMINEVRAEFEQEIASLRDELVRTRKHFDISPDLTSLPKELRPMLRLTDSTTTPAEAADLIAGDPAQTILPPREAGAGAEIGPDVPNLTEVAQSNGVVAPADLAEATQTVREQLAAPPPLVPTPAAGSVPAPPRPARMAATQPTGVLNSVQDWAPVPATEGTIAEPQTSDSHEVTAPPEPQPAMVTLSVEEHAQLVGQLEAVTIALHHLVAELRERGLLSESWSAEVEVQAQETLSR
ncbi:twin-arginine translocase TatA/TatE family subunit [Candidatus Chloroploca sp. M-50]|uniref:Twin-arginine translocase TatA/TatE family subunit n=1 Tax=Candidatus Chloroploca mongolica TaxID=2528176 RepID=A0ABS4DB06_9CHLR|nr:twin-arginine translocase TatA/TatE family subunit [Candidatus Chloroploca mongolica]MBP1466616.1 twin-arginine translocase TatA/TatE family subunit [Candidatus Chloroploca mongolica]